MFKFLSLLLLVFLILAQFALAVTISGFVTDPRGNFIKDVNISLDGQHLVNVDHLGKFSIELDLSQQPKLTFTHISYQTRMVRISSTEIVKVILIPAILEIQGVTVSENRAVLGETPIAFSDLTADDIKRDYTIGELPLLLESTPNLYAYADAGGGLGYSYIKIRGFDDKRIAVYINGVPLNDPEDQATYFVDIPDFAANVQDIQVQRGIGNSMYGDASFGGSVNIVSSTLEQPRQVTISTGFGGFLSDGKQIGDLEKQSVEYVSGLIDGRWNLAGRYSRQLSDGYRENSWYDGWSYYLSLSRLDPNMSTTFNVYGGPMRMHLAYWGIDKNTLDNNRRNNPLSYENETDNFNQPHYELHNTLQINDRTILHNTLFHIHGRGYYEQYKAGRKYSEYNIPAIPVYDSEGNQVNEITGGDLVRQQWVIKNQWGWTPRIEIQHDKGKMYFGGSFYLFESEHWGQVTWAEGINNSITPQHRYYEYFGDKYFASLYTSQNYHLSDKIILMANLQLRYQKYKFDQTKLGAFAGYDYDLDWLYLSPRVGISYLLHPKTSLYFSYSTSSRTPADWEIYDANDPDVLPSLEIRSISFATVADSSITFGNPTAKAERVHNFELGLTQIGGNYKFGVNLFWMDFRNEIIPFGGIDLDLGLPITANAKRSVHAGIELTGEQQLHERVKINANFSYNYNRIKDFEISQEVYDNDQNWNWQGYQTFNYNNKVIAGFPEYIGNLITEYNSNRFSLTYRGRFIGKQYLETANIENLAIKPYFVSAISGAVTLGDVINFGKLVFSVRFDNIFDKKYAATGYGGVVRFSEVEDLHWGEYIPAAGRSYFANLKLELN